MAKRRAVTTVHDYITVLEQFSRLPLERRVDILTRAWIRSREIFNCLDIAVLVADRKLKQMPREPIDQKSLAAGEREY